MKTVYRFLALSVMMAAVAVANTSLSFAQDDDRDALYEKFIGCYKETDKQKRDACFAIAKQYLDKSAGVQDEYVDFVKKRYDAWDKERREAALYDRFNKAVQNPQTVNADEAFASGRDIITAYPDLIDVPIVLASIGFDNAIAKTPNDRYNNDAINYAKMVIQKIERENKTSENYGAYAYAYKTKEFPDGRQNTLGWMNYTIGYIMYNRMNQKKEALPYFYKATQYNSGTKNNSEIYRTIGSWYLDEFLRIDKERVAKIEAAGNQDTDETKAMLALQRGYADRALDAYARAFRVASPAPESKAYRDSLMTRVRELYKIRFEKEDGIDAYLAGVTNRPFTDPTTAVTPIADDATTATTGNPATASKMTNTPETTTTTARPAGTGTTAAVKSNGATAQTAAAAKTTATKSTAAKPAAAKKPVAKKRN
jgi:hypothetical protein